MENERLISEAFRASSRVALRLELYTKHARGYVHSVNQHRATRLRNREGTIQASDTVMCLARIVRVIEPAFAVEQELVGVLPDREVHRLNRR